MKLMKVLVVALVAGGVFVPVPSQAEEGELLLIRCTPDYHDPSFGQRPPTMWFTIDLEKRTVKSWTHDFDVGDPLGKQKWLHSYIKISDRIFEITLRQYTDIYINIVRLTGEWNYNDTEKRVMGRCKKINNSDGQRMEIHPREFEF